MSREYIEKSLTGIFEKYPINLSYETIDDLSRSIFYINQAIVKNSHCPSHNLQYIIETLTYALDKELLEIKNIPLDAKKALRNFLTEVGISEKVMMLETKIDPVPQQITNKIPHNPLKNLVNSIKSFFQSSSSGLQETNTSEKTASETDKLNTKKYIEQLSPNKNPHLISNENQRNKISFIEKINKEREFSQNKKER